MTDTFLITGANRGIGLAMTRAALAQGHRVISVCRNPAGADELKALQAAHGALCQVACADVCDAPALARIAGSIEGAIDVLVCNAGGMSARGGINDVGNTIDDISPVLVTNMVGPFFTARAFLPVLARSGKPRIAIISSFMGSQKHTGISAYFYRASKAGANNLMVTMANELKAQGVAVAAYHPGWVKTDMGGSGADLTPEESASALLARFQALDMSQSGNFINYDGEPLPL